MYLYFCQGTGSRIVPPDVTLEFDEAFTDNNEKESLLMLTLVQLSCPESWKPAGCIIVVYSSEQQWGVFNSYREETLFDLADDKEEVAALMSSKKAVQVILKDYQLCHLNGFIRDTPFEFN